tara:strand:+ start:372 stop:608 length:237 start_codon:yes stop_codon:yes gene_type:complete
MLKAIQKEVENLRIKVYSGLSTEDTDTALYEIEQMLFKAMDKQLTLTDVVKPFYCLDEVHRGKKDRCKQQCEYCTGFS